ncbi:unnamed protein product [Amoebophrya sp. A25]|nr:unnamed protein product [Amoebophrya sp. A25]|eukprot:GSA25T00020908001.1
MGRRTSFAVAGTRCVNSPAFTPRVQHFEIVGAVA